MPPVQISLSVEIDVDLYAQVPKLTHQLGINMITPDPGEKVLF